MLKELAEYLVAQSAPTTLTFDGIQYVNRSMNLMAPPLAPKLTVNTLTGFADYIGQMSPAPTSDWIIWVESYRAVSMVSANGDAYGRRACLIRAELPEGLKPFRFDTFHDRETFVIGLQSLFVQTGPAQSVLGAPCHPYTQALLAAFGGSGPKQGGTV